MVGCDLRRRVLEWSWEIGDIVWEWWYGGGVRNGLEACFWGRRGQKANKKLKLIKIDFLYRNKEKEKS